MIRLFNWYILVYIVYIIYVVYIIRYNYFGDYCVRCLNLRLLFLEENFTEKILGSGINVGGKKFRKI